MPFAQVVFLIALVVVGVVIVSFGVYVVMQSMKNARYPHTKEHERSNEQ